MSCVETIAFPFVVQAVGCVGALVDLGVNVHRNRHNKVVPIAWNSVSCRFSARMITETICGKPQTRRPAPQDGLQLHFRDCYHCFYPPGAQHQLHVTYCARRTCFVFVPLLHADATVDNDGHNHRASARGVPAHTDVHQARRSHHQHHHQPVRVSHDVAIALPDI